MSNSKEYDAFFDGDGTPPLPPFILTALRAILVDPTVNVMTFGAKGDGATDDTVAIQAALTAGAGGVVYLPRTANGYRVTGTIFLNSPDTVLCGDGPGTRIISSAAGYAISIAGARVRVCDLKIERASTSFGAGIYVDGRGNDVELVNVTIDSGFMGIQLGDTNAPITPLRTLVEKCWITSTDSCIRTRTALDGTLYAYHRIINNDLIQRGSWQGIESWSGATYIAGNRVRAPAFNGGTAGITVGNKPRQQVIGNYVEGFSFGLEAGDTGVGIQFEGNTVISCGTGIALSSIGGLEEPAVCLVGNVVILTSSYPGGDQVCIYVTGARTFAVVGGALSFDSNGDYTQDASRNGTGIQAQNDCDSVLAVGVQLTNLNIGFRCGPIGGAAGMLGTIGCAWDNVKFPFDDQGGNPTTIVSGGRIWNPYQSHHNYRASYEGVTVGRNSDHPAASKGFAYFLDASSTVSAMQGCRFNAYVLGTAFTTDAERAITGVGYKRPAVEIRDHTWAVGNVSTWTDVATAIALAALPEPYDTPIHTWTSNLSFEKTRHGVVTHGTAAPAAGTWAVGDKVYNSTPVAGGTIGWVCTTAGTPGTWKTWGAIAA